ncbi:uncharacterized protein BO97DRAFT_251556 [Aspergillus homomorphus CBS 101889]|uniref:Uncharacterized protein n=1 Tax=Aspergillus homomorphus (strain CBS 101889) TaxID=1450537 RepID=A0A395HKI2_ASPHC|nr:hypothetical protein BO97DRAFT_251556 [Aspergillus homomorphus CBS 101889]RAL07438.1 hypothetical protein BO97DRAFT_251556 [Aspergillus homomorphus CBS 101889]
MLLESVKGRTWVNYHRISAPDPLTETPDPACWAGAVLRAQAGSESDFRSIWGVIKSPHRLWDSVAPLFLLPFLGPDLLWIWLFILAALLRCLLIFGLTFWLSPA